MLAAQAGFEVVNLQAVAGHAGLVESLLQRAERMIADQAGPWTRARVAFGGGGIGVGDAGVSASLTTHNRARPAASSTPAPCRGAGSITVRSW